MGDLVQPEYLITENGDPEPSERATLKIVLKDLGVEVDCSVPERYSAKIIELAGIAVGALGSVLMLWVGASAGYPAWVTAILALAVLGAGTKMSCRRRRQKTRNALDPRSIRGQSQVHRRSFTRTRFKELARSKELKCQPRARNGRW